MTYDQDKVQNTVQNETKDIASSEAQEVIKESDIQNTKHPKNVFAFIKQKIEKLSTALYMVTSYIAHDEPVRSSLRVLALSSVGHSGNLAHRQQSTHFVDLQKDIEHILALLRLAHTLDIISDMNAEILKSEYTKISLLVSSQRDNKSTEIASLESVFDSHYFAEAQNIQKNIQENINREMQNASPRVQSVPLELFKKIENTTDNLKMATATNINPTLSALQKPIYKKIKPLVESKERRNVRQSQVLSVLSLDTEMTIKDVAARVRGCSEKTIQRELNQLVENKKAKRLGEKRWSRYLKIS